MLRYISWNVFVYGYMCVYECLSSPKLENTIKDENQRLAVSSRDGGRIPQYKGGWDPKQCSLGIEAVDGGEEVEGMNGQLQRVER